MFSGVQGFVFHCSVVLKVNATQEAYPMKKDYFWMVFVSLA